MYSLRISAGVACAILSWASVVDAQSARRQPAPQRTQVAAPPPKPTVLVLPVAGDESDSIRTIVQRDLDYGDRLSVVSAPQSAVAALVPAPGAQPAFAAIAPLGAQRVVVARRSGASLQVSASDVTGARVVGERTFDVPQVPSLRPQVIRDSLRLAFVARDQAARARLATLASVRDSLLRATPRRGREQARATAVRDSMLDAIAYEQGSLNAAIARATVVRDSLLPFLLAADSAMRLSTMRAQRMAIHAVSDEVQMWLTGTRGIAASRIAYIRGGRVYAIDSDGANDEPVTSQGFALSPAWHPSGRSIVYSDLEDAGTQIAEVDLSSRRVQFLNATPRGLNLTPVYSPDGERIVYSTAQGGGYQLVYVARGSNVAVPIRGVVGDASSPSFSPDGRRLAFIAPRPWTVAGGSQRLTPQIFTMAFDSAFAGQLTPSTYGVRSYRTSPDWSPDGRYVAYMQQNGDFQVWVIGVHDKRMRKLTTVAENEDPTWAPDSRHLAITSTRGGAKDIWVLDIETGRARRLTSGGSARLPAWSPHLANPRRSVIASSAGGGGANR